MSTDDFSERHSDVRQASDAEFLSTTATPDDFVEAEGTGTPTREVVRVEPPQTGDVDIDAVLEQVAQAQSGDLSGRISAAQEAQRVLQSRLSDLAGM